MFERDYILRLVRQITQVLTTVLHLRGNGQYAEALATIDRALQRLFGFGLPLADSLSAEKLIELARMGRLGGSPDHALAADQLVALATLIREAGEVASDQGDFDQAVSSRMKALEIFLTALVEEDPESERAAVAIDPLVGSLAEYDLPARLKTMLWQHYEQSGQFALAENTLFELVEADDAPPDIIERGLAFYDRLSRLSDYELRQGNLPREELAAGRAQLQALC